MNQTPFRPNQNHAAWFALQPPSSYLDFNTAVVATKPNNESPPSIGLKHRRGGGGGGGRRGIVNDLPYGCRALHRVTFPVTRVCIPAGKSVARLEGALPQQPLGRDQLGGEVHVKPDDQQSRTQSDGDRGEGGMHAAEAAGAELTYSIHNDGGTCRSGAAARGLALSCTCMLCLILL